MNSEVEASIAAQLAELTRLVDPPKPPLGWGRDLSCVTDIWPDLREVDPASPVAITEAVTRRYITPRGALADDQDYGLDIRGHVNRGMTTRELQALSGALQGEAMKDDRVDGARVRLVAVLGSSSMSVHVVISPVDPALKDFEFTFSVGSSAVLMGTINA